LQSIGGQESRRLLSVLSIGQLVMIILFAPAFTAASLTGEKERNTMESLYASKLRPIEIVVGKMAGSLCFLLLTVLTGTVALVMPLLLGGVEWQEVAAITGINFMSAIFLGMLGLLVSTIMQRSYRAIICTYILLLIVCFAFALPAWPIGQGASLLKRSDPITQMFLHFLASLSPIEAMLSRVWPGNELVQGVKTLPPMWLVFLPLSIIMSLGIAVLCILKLRKPFKPPRPREKLAVVERNEVRASSVILYLWFFDPRRRRKNIAWWQNPVLMKEFRTRPMLQTRWLLRAFGICLITSVLLMILVSISISQFVEESTNMTNMMATAVAVMVVVLVVLIGPAIAGGTICSDIETGVWDLLRISPMRSWQIVSGKFQASIIPLILLAVATLPAMFILLVFDVTLLPNLLRICAVVGVTIIFVTTAGTFFSSIFRRTAVATAWAYGLVVSITLLTLLVLLAKDLFTQKFISDVFLINPIVAAMDAAGNVEMQKMGLLRLHIQIMCTATAVLLAVTVLRVFQLRKAD